MTTRRYIGPRERLAIFTAGGGVCYLCGGKIDGVSERWDVEHVIALELGGDETKGSDNLKPAHASCHKPKTAQDAGLIAKAKRREARHFGAIKPRSSLTSRKFKKKVNGEVVPR
jgi:5-methylcytosine-specific restriction protein A